MTLPNLLDTPAGRQVSVQAQTGPIERPSVPHEIRVGTRLRGGLTQTVPTTHLTAQDRNTIFGDWPPPQFAAEHEQMEAARDKLVTAWRRLRNLDAEVVADRRARIEDPDGAKRPRVDVDKLRQERQEAVVKAEVGVVQAADQVMGELRARFRDELPGDAEATAALIGKAERLRAEADRLDAEAQAARVMLDFKHRTLSSAVALSQVAALHTETLPIEGIARLPRMGSGRVA